MLAFKLRMKLEKGWRRLFYAENTVRAETYGRTKLGIFAKQTMSKSLKSS